MVDVEELGIIADGAPILAPGRPVGVTPATLLPTPVDPIVTVGTVAPVDPARVVVAEVAGERMPALVPMAVAPVCDVGESVEDVGDAAKDVDDNVEDVDDRVETGNTVEDVGDTVVVAGIVAAFIAGLLADVAAALFPIPDVLKPEALVVSSSRQEASASAKISRAPVLKTVSTTSLLCRSKTAGEGCSTGWLCLLHSWSQASARCL